MLLYSSFPFRFFSAGVFYLPARFPRVLSVIYCCSLVVSLLLAIDSSSCCLTSFSATKQLALSRAKSNKNSFEEFVAWVNEPDFCEKLQEAVRNPSAKSSVQLLKKMSPHIQSCSSKIPYTSSQRSASIKCLVAMRYFYGMPSVFLTYSPDDIHGVLKFAYRFLKSTMKSFRLMILDLLQQPNMDNQPSALFRSPPMIYEHYLQKALLRPPKYFDY